MNKRGSVFYLVAGSVSFWAVSTVYGTAMLNRRAASVDVKSPDWERVERYQDDSPLFSTSDRVMLPKSRHIDEGIVRAFGTDSPHSSTFLLHHGRGWDTNTGRVVILIHGASDHATRAWIKPGSLFNDSHSTGLAADLAERGFRVFAITFAHKHGNLFFQSEHIANAIEIVKAKTGADRVTLVGHSAGGISARAYVSGYRLDPTFTSYRGDVDQLVTIATPHRGLDYQFRHPMVNYFFLDEKDPRTNAPMSWDGMWMFGLWRDTQALSIYGDAFPMQQQLLWNWRDRIPLSGYMDSIDSTITYGGGFGLFGHSQGIEAAIKKGGYYLRGLEQHPVDPNVEVVVIAGNQREIPGVFNETDAPSDGLIFEKSATYVSAMIHPDRRNPIRVVTSQASHHDIIFSLEAKRETMSSIETLTDVGEVKAPVIRPISWEGCHGAMAALAGSR